MNTRDRIIEGAARAVTERGFQATSVQHILDAAELSRRTYYKHFRDKEGALAAVYEQQAEALLAAMTEALSGPAPQRINAAVDAYVAFQQERSATVLSLQTEAIRAQSQLAPIRSRTMDRIVGLIADSVHEATGVDLAPELFRALVLGLEGLVLEAARDDALTPPGLEHIATVTKALFSRVLGLSQRLPRASSSTPPIE